MMHYYLLIVSSVVHVIAIGGSGTPARVGKLL